LTQPDVSLAKFVFMNKESKKPERGSQSMVNNPDGTPLAAFQSITASPGQKSPRSTVPFNKSNGNARGFLNS